MRGGFIFWRGNPATVSIHSYFQIIDDACGTFVFFANTNLQEN
ncbi:hypothetical protein M899_3101 [Bacteriovorax sp. BSW11_IV]|nr:hypothetical protein M899_3101 [Bacteriovorax sp. BSW11_IV]